MSLPTGARDYQNTERPAALARLFAIVCAAVIPYLMIASTTFLSDDSFYVRIYSIHGLRDLPALFYGDWSYGLWGYPLAEIRPVAAAMFMFDWRFWGANPVGYHLSNILLHAICAILIALIARKAAKVDAGIAALAGILFALQPAHVGAVAWITGRVDVLATVFCLAAIAAYIEWRESKSTGWHLASLLIFVAALFSKELAITLPVLVFAFEMTLGKARAVEALKRASWHGVALFGYVILRTATLGSLSGPQYYLSGSAGYVFFKSQPTILVSLLPPFDLLLLAMRSRWAFALLTAAVVCGIVIARRRPGAMSVSGSTGASLLFFAIFWYAITALPMLTTNEEMRRYYLPSAGVCVAIAILVSMIRPARLRLTTATALIVLSAVSLVVNLTTYRRVAAAADDAHTSIVSIATSTQQRSMVVTALPASHKGIPLWSTTNPIAYEPPFSPPDLTQSLTVIESPSAYVTDSAWHRAYDDAVSHKLGQSAETCAIVYFEPRVERAMTTPLACNEATRMIDAYLAATRAPVPDDYYGAYTRSWNDYWTRIARDRRVSR